MPLSLSDTLIFIPVISAIVAVIGAVLSNRARRSDQERSRRVEALNMMKQWHQRNYEDTNQHIRLRAILDVLTPEQCQDVERFRAFTVENQYLPIFERFFEAIMYREGEKAKGEETQHISLDQCRVLRAHIVKYINLLEIVAASYTYHVADRNMIYNEFESVLFTRSSDKDNSAPSGLAATGRYICRAYITATDRYPALDKLESSFRARAKLPKQVEYDMIT